jgi:effector-binding domain-containing protein/ribosome-associated toxin RatA of RatAB toxin-antitoxin module
MLLIVVGAIYLATLNGTYDVKRSRIINAEPEVVFNEINDYKNWKDWGPWYEQDSTIVPKYDANTIGKGAGYSWTRKKEGGGSMETVDVEKPNRINQVVYFKTPFGEMKSDILWIMDKVDEGTNVTWEMKGEIDFFYRFMTKGMEKQMGPMLERGLELLGKNIEDEVKIYSIQTDGVIDYSGGFYLYNTTSSRIEEIGAKYPGMLSKIDAFIKENSIRTTGAPFTLYHKYDELNGTAMYSVCYPVSERINTPTDTDILSGFMESGKYYKTILKGSYMNSKEAWTKANAAVEDLSEYQNKENGEPFELYVNSPIETPSPADLITEVYIPVEKIKAFPLTPIAVPLEMDAPVE